MSLCVQSYHKHNLKNQIAFRGYMNTSIFSVYCLLPCCIWNTSKTLATAKHLV